MCGIVGIVAGTPVNQELYDALTILQHRGQDAAGIMTAEGDRLHLRKRGGLVRDVFSKDEHVITLRGNVGIGHVRYPTAGSMGAAEAQPLYTNTPFGIAMAHNGNLTNSDELKQALFHEDRRHINTDSDTEVLLNVFAHELMMCGSLRISPEDVFTAVSRVHRRARGAYACVCLIAGHGIVGFRDPFGIRPMVYGHRERTGGADVMIASESVALDALGFETTADLEPGEAIYITVEGRVHRRQCATATMHSPCILEYVYLARPDSVIDGVCVYKARQRMGEKLAEKIEREWPNHDIDVVIPIPDTSRVAGVELATRLGVKYREGFIKNRYIGRTFIMPGQRQRMKGIRQKLNPVDLEFAGKNVLLIDDSIIRGTTSRQVIQMAREAGASKVYFASASPPVRYPNVYGIDIPTFAELVAHGRTIEELQPLLGADRLVYQDLEDLIDAIRAGDPRLTRFDVSVFTGDYVTQDVTTEYLSHLESRRLDAARAARTRLDGDSSLELSDTAS